MAGKYGVYDSALGGTAPRRPGYSGDGSSGRASFWPGKKIIRWILLIAATCFLAVELIWFVGLSPFMPFSRIEVSGSSGYDTDSLLAYAGLTPRSSFAFTDTSAMEALLAELPQLESVRVVKRFPDRLDIHIQDRRPVALTLADIEGVTVPVLLDSRGVVFQIGTAFSRETFTDLPVISGLINEPPVLGMRLPARASAFLEDLESLRENAPELLSGVSEIHFDRNSAGGFDLILYLQHKKNKVRLFELNETGLQYSLLMADILTDVKPGVEAIDFRAGLGSYYQKEVPSEQR